ncbi:MAG: MFS transporter [Actinomycetota bacterium]
MARPLESVFPRRLGTNFRWLVSSSWATNLGDGMGIAAGPLLVESLTDDPLLVGLAWLVGRLPALFFGLHAGVAADRFDRRRLLIVANLARAGVIAVLAITIATDAVGIGLVLAALFVLGVAETLADTTSHTLLPMIVRPGDLTTGNTRLMFGFIGLDQLVGPSIGAILFAVGASVPFFGQAVVLAFGVVLASRLRLGPVTAPDPTATTVRREIAAGLRWLWGHAAIRTLAITVAVFNLTFGAAFSVLVVLATERLGLGEVGFGVLTSISALGGILGTVVYHRVEARIGMAAIMRIGLVIEASTHLVFATATTAWPAMVAMFCFGVHASMWGTTAATIRQASVPEHLQGRITAVYGVGLKGGLVIGAAAGAVLAQVGGITAPYWFAFVGSTITLVLIWRSLAHIARSSGVGSVE